MKDALLNRSNLLWFIPGLHVKRWFILMIAGVTLIGLGIGFILVEIYREATLPTVFYYLTLQFIPRWLRGLLLGALGLGAFFFGLYRLNRTLIESVRGNDTQPIVKKLVRQYVTSQGPRIVAIGGGHGLAALLRGLKQHTSNITAIVTVADDGGSSGRLRREFGVLPPGDFRMCISALADDESLVSQLMQYRFGGGSGLSGHSFGNLFITAMAELTGSFERAILESSKVVASQGRIVPSTLTDVTLCAEYKAPDALPVAIGPMPLPAPVRGESSIGKKGLPIERVWLEPADPPAYPEAIKAILEADLVVLGPGSLFTSVMPNLLVPEIVQALRETPARCIYVCNVATERGETDRFSMSDHVHAIERHIGSGILDAVLVNDRVNPNFQLPSGVDIVLADSHVEGSTIAVVRADLADDAEPWRHDSAKLADAVLKFIRD
ncbi:MAG: putative gluconeogenesis factor [Candidatus Roseilinea sp.]|nr:MAG: putative gluconeogenesis factor [Candidatus Roseilinea sp.]